MCEINYEILYFDETYTNFSELVRVHQLASAVRLVVFDHNHAIVPLVEARWR